MNAIEAAEKKSQEIKKYLTNEAKNLSSLLLAFNAYRDLHKGLEETDTLLSDGKQQIDDGKASSEIAQKSFELLVAHQIALSKHFNKLQEIIELKGIDKNFGKCVEKVVSGLKKSSNQLAESDLLEIRNAYLKAYFRKKLATRLEEKGRSHLDLSSDITHDVLDTLKRLEAKYGEKVAIDYGVAYGMKVKEQAEQTPGRDTTKEFDDLYNKDWYSIDHESSVANLYVVPKDKDFAYISYLYIMNRNEGELNIVEAYGKYSKEIDKELEEKRKRYLSHSDMTLNMLGAYLSKIEEVPVNKVAISPEKFNLKT